MVYFDVPCFLFYISVFEVGNVLGDILPDKSILMVNHQSVIDGPLLFAVLGKRGLGHTMGYLGDHWIKFTTNYGYCSMFARDVFINQVTQPTRHTYPMFDQCWPTVYDVGPTLTQHCFNVSCLLGSIP